VVDTGLHGRVIPRRSWAWPPDIAEMADLPRIVHRLVPWIRYDPARIYAAGDSMGGQETLMLVALHPDLLAAAVAADPVTNFLRRWYQFPISGESWGEQVAATREVGASPRVAPWLYVRRSPSFFARTVAFSRVPLQLWWSPHDTVVIREGRSQTGRFYADVKRLDPSAPVFAHRLDRMHGWVFRYDHELPAMVRFLLAHTRAHRPPADFAYTSWRPRAAIWGWRIRSLGSDRRLWSISGVTLRHLRTDSPGPLLLSPPIRPGTALVDGRLTPLRDGAVPVPAGRHDVKLVFSPRPPAWAPRDARARARATTVPLAATATGRARPDRA
jgi:pimeloyl-ACP methyl ester carboxylesterase